MRIKTPISLAASAILVGCSNPSGVYLHAAENEADMIQLVRSPDGKLASHVETVSYNSNGQISRQSLDFDGSLDGSQLILTARGVLGITKSITGTLSGNKLAVFVGGQEEDFHRASAPAFDQETSKVQVRAVALANQLKAQAVELATEKETAQTTSEEQLLRTGIGELQASLPELQRQLSAAEAQYADLNKVRIGRLDAAKQLESIPGEQRAANAQSIAANHADVSMNDVRVKVGGLRSSVEDSYDIQRDRIERLKQTCVAVAGSQANNLITVCSRVQQDRNDFNALAVQLRQVFGDAAVALQPHT